MRAPSNCEAEKGSVTAELALALPAVSLVLAIMLSGFSLQLERLKLVDLAATASRAVARGETIESMQSLASQFRPRVKLKLVATADLLCATASADAALMGLQGFEFRLSERQCARKQGM